MDYKRNNRIIKIHARSYTLAFDISNMRYIPLWRSVMEFIKASFYEAIKYRTRLYEKC